MGTERPSALVRLRARTPWLDEERRQQVALHEIGTLTPAGRFEDADAVAERALRRVRTARRRATLLDAVVTPALAAGRQPPLTGRAVSAWLALADRQLARDKPEAAARSFDHALRLAFHRVLHFDHVGSPLADDPAHWTLPFRHSAVARVVAAPRGRTGRADEDRPRRRLRFATIRNADFLGDIRAHYDARPDVHSSFVDLLGVREVELAPARLVPRVLAGEPAVDDAATAAVRALLADVDVLFVEWCTALAVVVSGVDPGSTRVVVRVHAYEPFTRWPQLVDFSRIDDVVFVSEHLRDLCVAAVPGLTGADGPRLHVVANAMDLRACVRPKDDEARFTLALVGANKVVKDPRWAIDVLRRLREHDERYRLLLIGRDFQDDRSEAEIEYAAALRGDLAELEPVGAVERVAHTDDVPAALQRVGVVLSTSVRESFHVGLVEGAASGAVPVVRDWPFFPGAAARLFGPDWVVGTPAEGAERVLALTRDVGTWRDAGAAASGAVVDRWDWSVVSRDLDRVLLGEV